MIEAKNNLGLKAIIGVLAILLLISLGFTFKMSSDVQNVTNKLSTSVMEKEAIIKDLKKLSATYDAAIAENSSMSEELIKERDKITTLMKELKLSKGDVSQYKIQVVYLQKKMKMLIAENEELKKENKTIIAQRDSTVIVLDDAKKYNNDLTTENKQLNKRVERAGKLTIYNIKATAFILKKSGKQIETDKASRADILRISFEIAENSAANPGIKTYYVQIIDNNSNVLGERKTEIFGKNTLIYSYIATIDYENRALNVLQDLSYQDLKKGTYFVNIFEKNIIVAKTSLTLR